MKIFVYLLLWYFCHQIITKALEYLDNRPQKQLEKQIKENEDKDAAIAVLKEELSKQKDELLNHKATMDEQMIKLVVANVQIRKEKNKSISALKLDDEKTKKELRKQRADILKHKAETDVQKREYETLEVVINAIREENRNKNAAIAVLKAEEEKTKQELKKQREEY